LTLSNGQIATVASPGCRAARRECVVRSFLPLFFALIFLGQMICAPARAQAPFQTTAPNAFLIDAETGSVLFEKNADALVTPASTVKIMTAELVFRELKAGRLKLDDEFTVSENAWRTGGAMARGSSMFAALNSRVRIEDLIRGLVVVSGNDAAIILAEGIAGTEQAFADRMTKRAAELGLPHLTVRNAWGKDDPGQKVAARDMALLAAHIIRTYPEYYSYFAEREFVWNKIRQQNRNPLLGMGLGADGLKTGNIDEASGYGLVGSAVQNDQRLILAIYGLRNAKDRSEEARKLIQWGFRSFETKAILTAGENVGSARLYGGEQMSVPLVSPGPVRVLVPRGATERLTAKIVYQGPVMAPVKEGVELARLKVYRGTTLALDTALVAGETVQTGPIHRRAFDAGLELGQSLVRTYVLKP
jgi:D-alanyl-D-alanine carboxypeptidase (penicillin-binding protein 5/6)